MIKTTVRYKFLNNMPLTSEEARYIVSLMAEDIGYPAPDNEKDEESTDASVISIPVADKYDEYWKPGAAYGRQALNAKGITFHHASGTMAGTIDWLTVTKGATASYHVLIDQDGSRCRFVDDNYRAYHAGRGQINGRNPNHVCLAIAFVGDTVTGKYRDQKELSDVEIESAFEFITPRWKKMGLSHDWVTDHRTTDPNRRNDLAMTELERLKSLMRLRFD